MHDLYHGFGSACNVRQTSGSSDQDQIEIAFAPLPLGGAGEGRCYGKEKSKLLVCAGFQPARDLFGYRLVAAPLPNPSQREGNLLNQSFLQFVARLRQAKAGRTSNDHGSGLAGAAIVLAPFSQPVSIMSGFSSFQSHLRTSPRPCDWGDQRRPDSNAADDLREHSSVRESRFRPS